MMMSQTLSSDHHSTTNTIVAKQPKTSPHQVLFEEASSLVRQELPGEEFGQHVEVMDHMPGLFSTGGLDPEQSGSAWGEFDQHVEVVSHMHDKDYSQ